MDNSTHKPMPMPNPEPAPPAPALAPPAGAPQEATGDSESDAAPGSTLTVGDRPSVPAAYAEDDAESCSGAGGGENNWNPVDDDDDSRGADDVAMEVEGDGSEVDSRMCVPWWRRTTVQLDAPDGASAGAGGGCGLPQAAVAADVVAGPAGHTAESNRLFWEACIAHGY